MVDLNSASCKVSHTDRCLKKGFGATCSGISEGSVVTSGHEISHQYSRVISSKTRTKSIHKIERCNGNTLVEVAKEIWEYLLNCEITITEDYFPNKLNLAADWYF